MSDERTICLVCGWRERCDKRFSLPAAARCPDFVRDVSIKSGEAEESNETKRGKKRWCEEELIVQTVFCR